MSVPTLSFHFDRCHGQTDTEKKTKRNSYGLGWYGGTSFVSYLLVLSPFVWVTIPLHIYILKRPVIGRHFSLIL